MRTKWYLLFVCHYIVFIISVSMFHGWKIIPSPYPQELINLTLWTSMHWSFLPVDVIFFLHLIIIYILFNWSLYILSSGISFWSYHGDCHSSSRKSIGFDWFRFQILQMDFIRRNQCDANWNKLIIIILNYTFCSMS